jgi:hypothetical protein
MRPAVGSTVRANFSQVITTAGASICVAAGAGDLRCENTPCGPDAAGAAEAAAGTHSGLMSASRANLRSSEPAVRIVAMIFSAWAMLPALGAATGRRYLVGSIFAANLALISGKGSLAARSSSKVPIIVLRT